jgi:uncharacterized protein YlxW (UPF0749 family)
MVTKSNDGMKYNLYKFHQHEKVELELEIKRLQKRLTEINDWVNTTEEQLDSVFETDDDNMDDKTAEEKTKTDITFILGMIDEHNKKNPVVFT